MRVITGSARGRKLKTLAGDEIVRPTAERVKEALFSIVQFELEGAAVLDAFAGSGQLGIEALSRGAARAVFTDENRQAVDTVRENLQHTRLADRAVVLQTDAFSYLRSARETFDVLFFDPPYRKGTVEKILPLAERCCNPGAIIVCETEVEVTLPESVGALTRLREYKYSKTKLTTYRMQEDAE